MVNRLGRLFVDTRRKGLRCCEMRYSGRHSKIFNFVEKGRRGNRARSARDSLRAEMIYNDKIVTYECEQTLRFEILAGTSSRLVSNVKLCVISLIAAAHTRHAEMRPRLEVSLGTWCQSRYGCYEYLSTRIIL